MDKRFWAAPNSNCCRIFSEVQQTSQAAVRPGLQISSIIRNHKPRMIWMLIEAVATSLTGVNKSRLPWWNWQTLAKVQFSAASRILFRRHWLSPEPSWSLWAVHQGEATENLTWTFTCIYFGSNDEWSFTSIPSIRLHNVVLMYRDKLKFRLMLAIE